MMNIKIESTSKVLQSEYVKNKTKESIDDLIVIVNMVFQ